MNSLFSDINKSVLLMSSVTHPTSAYNWAAADLFIEDHDANTTLLNAISDVVDPHLLLGVEPIRLISADRVDSITTVYKFEKAIGYTGHSNKLSIYGLCKRSDLLSKSFIDSRLISYAEKLAMTEMWTSTFRIGLYNRKLYINTIDTQKEIELPINTQIKLYDLTGLFNWGQITRIAIDRYRIDYNLDLPDVSPVYQKTPTLTFKILPATSTTTYNELSVDVDYKQVGFPSAEFSLQHINIPTDKVSVDIQMIY